MVLSGCCAPLAPSNPFRLATQGITGYRDDSLETVKRNQQQYDLPLTILSYKVGVRRADGERGRGEGGG